MNILHIDCSPRQSSQSRELSAAILMQLLAINPDATITRRDLGRHPIAHAHTDYATALSSPGALTPQQLERAVELSEQLIREVENADALVIGIPMNNFTVPSVFKAWIDQVLRMGRTIKRSASGEKIGLLDDRRVYIGITSGGIFTGDNARQPDFLTPYLTAAFEVIGITSLQFFPLQATVSLSPDQLKEAQSALLKAINTESR